VARNGILIIGIGSPLRGDDAAGPAAARRLAARGFRALNVHQLTPELAEEVASAREVYFLDAHSELTPGEVSVEEITETERAIAVLEHRSSPAGLLRLVRTAYGAEPSAWLVSMGGRDFELSERLTPEAEQAVERAIEEVVRCTNQE